MSNDFFGYTSSIPRPPEAPEDPQAKRMRELQAERDQQRTAAILQRAQEGRAAIAKRFEDIRQEAIAAEIESFKNEQMQAYARTGVGPTEFAKLWPGILADHQRELASADPLEAEKARIKKQSNYTL